MSVIVGTRFKEKKVNLLLFVLLILKRCLIGFTEILLHLNLLKSELDVRFYKVLKSLYSCSVSPTEVNNIQTDGLVLLLVLNEVISSSCSLYNLCS